ncbi:hypothetical protein [Nonomuraea rubra]|uniref:hypothetical protein n=1 Tax=Nonomuraea rubra TaxID=46180 RepID=UPI0033CBF1E6
MFSTSAQYVSLLPTFALTSSPGCRAWSAKTLAASRKPLAAADVSSWIFSPVAPALPISHFACSRSGVRCGMSAA